MADEWKDKYRTGSFRGVSFRTTSHQKNGGRRKQDREYAARNVGNSEDLGKKLPAHVLNIYVVGDDYFSQRDALIRALDEEGPGVLVHPYLGTFNAQVGSYTLTETVEEGRVARFSVEFSDAGEIRFPDQVTDDIQGTINNANDAIDDTKSFFEDVFSTANQPSQVLNSASASVKKVTGFLNNTVKKVREPIANLTFAIRNLEANVDDLIKRPGELADILSDTFNTLLDELSNNPEDASRVLGNFSNLPGEFEPVIGDTPSRNTERANQDAIVNLAQQLALSNNAKAIVDIDFLSTRDALQKRDEVIDEIDNQLDNTDDELFQAFKNVQASLTQLLPRTGTSELITITPVKTVPALVLAYDNFQDLDKENEIIEENSIEHPGFVPGGEPINVSAG